MALCSPFAVTEELPTEEPGGEARRLPEMRPERAEFAIAMVLSLTGEPRRHPVETPGDASSGQKSAEIDGDEDHRDLSTWYPDEEKGERAMFLTGSDERSGEIAADGPDSSTSN